MEVAMGLSVIVMVVFALLYGVLLLFALASYVISGVSFLKISKKLISKNGFANEFCKMTIAFKADGLLMKISTKNGVLLIDILTKSC